VIAFPWYVPALWVACTGYLLALLVKLSK